MISWLTGFLADAQWSKEKKVRPILIYLTALATRGKHPNWLLGGVFPTTYILGGKKTQLEITTSESAVKKQEEFEEMKKKTRNMMFGLAAVFVLAVAGMAAYKAMH